MKQYCGNKQFQNENTPKQNEQCLRNFDLSEYRQLMSDIAVWTYQGIVNKIICNSIAEGESRRYFCDRDRRGS